MQLRTTTALVTGANRGLGAELVRRLLAAGVPKVYAGARDTAPLQALVDAQAGRVVAVPLDITDPAQVALAAARCGVRLLHSAQNRSEWFISRRCATSWATT